MIELFNFESAHCYGDAFPTLLKLRYCEFVERLKYEVPTYNQMEYDQYDTPAAVYIVWRDKSGDIRAGTRISPTHRPYMVKDLWPQSAQFQPLPEEPAVWEATRLFIDRALEGAERQRAHGEILCSYLEFALSRGIRSYIGVAPPGLWKYTFLKCGWPVEFIGNPLDIGYSENGRPEKIIAGLMPVNAEILNCVRSNMNIGYEVITNLSIPMENVA